MIAVVSAPAITISTVSKPFSFGGAGGPTIQKQIPDDFTLINELRVRRFRLDEILQEIRLFRNKIRVFPLQSCNHALDSNIGHIADIWRTDMHDRILI